MMSKKTNIFILIYLLYVIFLSFPVWAESVDRIVAKVGSDVITQSELNAHVQGRKVSLMQQFGEKEGAVKVKEFEANALQEMILQKILESEIMREKISVTDPQVEEEYRARVRQSGMPEPEFISQIGRYGLSLPAYKINLKKEMEKRDFIQKKIIPKMSVSDYDLQQEYEKRKGEFLTYKKFRFIEVYLTPEKLGSNDQLVKVLNAIGSLLMNDLPAGELIRQFSSGIYASKSGDSGLVEGTMLRPEIRDILTRLKVGETSRPVPVGNGVFLFKLMDRQEPFTVPFNDVVQFLRMQVSERTVQDELRRYLMSVKDQTFVEIIP